MAADPLLAKKVVIVGGTAGIGFAVAEAALQRGAAVVVASSQPAGVEAALGRLGKGAEGSTLDVTDEADVAGFFERLGGFDHLVFTAGDWAGMGGAASLAELDLSAAKAAFGVRFWGALAVVKHGCGKIAAGGSITLTDGMLAHRPRKGAPVSTAMLGAIESLTQALAVELAPVRVNAVCPGLVMTERSSAMPEAVLKRFTARLPLARGAEPAEVAEAYLYLMRGGYTTGQVLRVDGGGSIV
ncbi:MAG TPA: SDR family oxidoreductase [Caulobacteraceae bacterium]|jgi:NAD(P)-dependent dehydrogenase (short-subunit alcohol dehydrogenase family)